MSAAVNAGIEHIWARVQAEMATRVEDSTYRIWLAPDGKVESINLRPVQ